MNLNKEPIYRQLTRILRQSVNDGSFTPGDQFLTEKSICETYNVSRATAGKALSSLIAEGILDLRKGIGTFVTGHSSPYDLQSLLSFTVMAEQLNKKAGTEILEFRRMRSREAGDEILSYLKVGPEETLIFCRRIRLLDGKPALLDRRYIRESYCHGLTREDALGSLIQIWTERYGLVIGGTDQFIQAALLDSQEARQLSCRQGACALRLSSVGLLDNGDALWYENSLFPGDQYVIRNRLSNARDTAPARRMFIGES